MNEQGEVVSGSELDEIRGDIREIVAKLDRMIGDRSDETDPART